MTFCVKTSFVGCSFCPPGCCSTLEIAKKINEFVDCKVYSIFFKTHLFKFHKKLRYLGIE
jgi:hypothetical protein